MEYAGEAGGTYQAVELVQEEGARARGEHRVEVFEDEDAGSVRPRVFEDGADALLGALI